MQWTATDDAGGSGVKGVTVYVAEDGGDYQIWLDQTTATSGIYKGQAGHTYQFLALATDNAGNHEQPPVGRSRSPATARRPTSARCRPFASTSTDLGHAAHSPARSRRPTRCSPRPSRGSPRRRRTTRPTEFQKVLQPFTGQAFATGHRPERGGHRPGGDRLSLPDGSVLVSGGPGRNQLFRFTAEGGRPATPLATVPFPIYDMAFDTSGNALGHHRRRPAARARPADRRRSSASSATA